MDVAGVVARANAAVSLGVRYKLGKGGMNPNLPTPAVNGQCDCSGFVAWCLGMSRRTMERFYVEFNGGWIETTAVWSDIGSPVGILEPASEDWPGAVVVYPDTTEGHGHIGVIVEPGQVAHCSKGNDTRTGNAIQITALDVFRANPRTRFGWLHGLAQPAAGRFRAGEAMAPAASGVPAGPNYRSLVPGGFFSRDPSDLSVKRSIRTNNPGALNISNWQKSFPGYVGVTQPDSAGNVTAIYITPEHGVGAWYHLLAVRYGYGRTGSLVLGDLARRYSGTDSPESKAAKAYLAGWRRWSNNAIDKDSVISMGDSAQVLTLARAMFGHEIGDTSPLHDDQIVDGVRRERDGTLPPS